MLFPFTVPGKMDWTILCKPGILAAMPAFYRAPLHRFVQESTSSILGDLAVANGSAKFQLTPEAVEAWKLQLPTLISGCCELMASVPKAADYEILLEYPIPRVGKRIDAVLLMNDVIVAIETKTGHAPTLRSARWTITRFTWLASMSRALGEILSRW